MLTVSHSSDEFSYWHFPHCNVILPPLTKTDLPEQIPETDVPPSLKREIDSTLDEFGLSCAEGGIEVMQRS